MTTLFKSSSYVLIDFSALFMRAFQVIPEKEFISTEESEIITKVFSAFVYNFLSTVENTTKTPYPSVICYDYKPYDRFFDFSEYKQNRESFEDKKLEMFKTSKQACLDFLGCFGFGEALIKGAEADDLIAFYLQNVLKEANTIIYSSDSDLFQFLSYDRNLNLCYWTKKDKVRLFKNYSFEDFSLSFPHLAFNPSLHKLLLALTGGHNNAFKIKGLGEVNALKLLMGIPIEYLETPEKALEYLLENVSFKGIPLKESSILLRQALTLQTFPYPSLIISKEASKKDASFTIEDFKVSINIKKIHELMELFKLSSTILLTSLIERVCK